MFDHVEKSDLLSEVSRCPSHMPMLSAHSSWLSMALSLEDTLSTPSAVDSNLLCTATPGAGSGHPWTLEVDGGFFAGLWCVPMGVADLCEPKQIVPGSHNKG